MLLQNLSAPGPWALRMQAAVPVSPWWLVHPVGGLCGCRHPGTEGAAEVAGGSEAVPQFPCRNSGRPSQAGGSAQLGSQRLQPTER